MKNKFKKFRLLNINLSAKSEIKKSLFARVSDTKLFSTLHHKVNMKKLRKW